MGKYTALVEDHLILPAFVRQTEGRERQFRRAGRNSPGPVAVRLLIDTGSKRTTLTPGVLQHIAPSLCGRARIITPLEVGQVELFWVRLEFPLETRLAPFETVAVARLRLPPRLSQFDGLLGRDLLCRLESFEYLGRRGRYRLRDTPGWLGWLRRWL
jgi:hypothetical protein